MVSTRDPSNDPVDDWELTSENASGGYGHGEKEGEEHGSAAGCWEVGWWMSSLYIENLRQ